MFAFGFQDEDIEGSSLQNVDQNSVNPLDSPHLNDSLSPELESSSSLIDSLTNVRISFEKYTTPHGNTVYRRALFDIKHQLMAEDDDSQLDILNSEDLRRNVYEGGLKSWECSIDLVDLLSNTNIDENSVLELGCGTALPSLYIFGQRLLNNRPLQLLLSDYNKSVIRLVTLPNLIITWSRYALSDDQRLELQKSDQNIVDYELLLTPEFLQAFQNDLSNRNIDIKFISGSWGRQFSHVIEQQLSPSSTTLVLTSETIYQPENLPVIAETLLQFHRTYSARSLVAAKDIYFGVGGSIVEFENYLNKIIKHHELNVRFNTLKINAGLKRSIVYIY